MGIREFDEYSLALGDEVTKPAKKIETALDRLLARFPKIGGAATSLSRGLVSTLGGAARRIQGVFARPLGVIGTSLSTMFGSLASDAVRFAGRTAAALGKGAVDIVDFGQESKRVLGAAFRDANKGADAYARVRTMLGNLGGGMQELAEIRDVFARSGQLGLNPAEAELVAQFRFDLEGLGVSAEDARSTIDKLFRAGATGQLNNRLLAELGQAGFDKTDVEKGVAKRMGISLEQLRKMGEDEILPFGIVMSELLQQSVNRSGKRLGQVGEEIGSHTIGGLIDDLKGRLLQRTLDAIDPMGEGIVGKFGGVADRLEKVIGPKIDAFFTTENVDRWMKKLEGFDANAFIGKLERIVSAVGTLAEWILKLAGAVEKIDRIGGQAMATEKQRSETGTLGAGAPKFANVLAEGLIPGLGLYRQIKDDINGSSFGTRLWKEIGSNGAAGIASGLAGGQAGVEKAATALAGSAASASREELGIKSPSKVFFEQGEEIDAGLAEGMTYNDLAAQTAEEVARGTAQAARAATMRERTNYQTVTRAAADTMTRGSAAVATMGDVSVVIQIDGSRSPQETAAAVQESLELQLGIYFERLLQGVGA